MCKNCRNSVFPSATISRNCPGNIWSLFERATFEFYHKNTFENFICCVPGTTRRRTLLRAPKQTFFFFLSNLLWFYRLKECCRAFSVFTSYLFSFTIYLCIVTKLLQTQIISVASSWEWIPLLGHCVNDNVCIMIWVRIHTVWVGECVRVRLALTGETTVAFWPPD